MELLSLAYALAEQVKDGKTTVYAIRMTLGNEVADLVNKIMKEKGWEHA